MDLGLGYSFNMEHTSLSHNNNPISLSKNEAKMLHLLCLNYDSIISLETIRATVWLDKAIGTSNIRDTILRLRKKIEPLRLENVSGAGYKLNRQV